MEQNKEIDNCSKKDNKSDKKDELEDIEIMNENDKKDGEDSIKLEEELKKYIEDKTFILNNKYKLNLEILYYKISKRKPLNILDCFYRQSFAIILFDGLFYIFFYKLTQVEVKLLFENGKKETEKFSICSTYELLQYCKNKNFNPYVEIENKKIEFNELFGSDFINIFEKFGKIILVQDYRNYDDYKKENLLDSYPIDNYKLEPEKLSKFFDLFFLFDKNSKFDYWDNAKRSNFIYFIASLKDKKDIYCIKICGPSAIGKSMSLFLLSKFSHNFLYYNLKAIKNLQQSNDDVKIQNIITESCKYLALDEEQVKELSSILKTNRILPFFKSLKNIAQFLIKYNIKSIIILDQFKNNTIDKKDYESLLSIIEIQKIKNVKLLICSSTNDKEIRDECIKSWRNKIFSLKQLNAANQKYFFYIDELYNKIKEGDSFYDNVLANFNFIPKYKNIFEYLQKEKDVNEKLNNDLKTIKERVKNNLKALYSIIYEKDKSEEIITMRMVEDLRYLDLHLDEKTSYDELEQFAGRCSFKYYRFTFEDTYFKINYNFPYMKEIVYEITNTHLEEFYKFKRNKEHTSSANSDFFELYSGYSMKKGILKLPNSQNSFSVRVNEIVKMREFIPNQLDNAFQREIYSKLQEFKINKNDFSSKNKEVKKELESRNLLLELSDIINFYGKDIEYYKFKYLDNLEKEYSIKGNKEIGNMSIFINQNNQRGKMLDLAYVYGDKENKTFIGFQMKAYNEDSSHGIKFDITKDDIKKALQPMIVNIKYLMGMDIKSWHYVVVILYDKTKEKGKQYFSKIVELCNTNGFDYIFYEPFENLFYDRNLKNIKKYETNQYSNLDYNIATILPINIIEDIDIDDYMNDFSNYIQNHNLNDINYIEEGLNSLIKKKRKRSEKSELKWIKRSDEIKSVLSDISDKIIKSFKFKFVKFVGAYNFLKTFDIPKPKIFYLLLLPSKDNDTFFIIFNKNNNKGRYYKYKTSSKSDNKDAQIISSVNSESMYGQINKNEKFYAFIFEGENNNN